MGPATETESVLRPQFRMPYTDFHFRATIDTTISSYTSIACGPIRPKPPAAIATIYSAISIIFSSSVLVLRRVLRALLACHWPWAGLNFTVCNADYLPMLCMPCAVQGPSFATGFDFFSSKTEKKKQPPRDKEPKREGDVEFTLQFNSRWYSCMRHGLDVRAVANSILI